MEKTSFKLARRIMDGDIFGPEDTEKVFGPCITISNFIDRDGCIPIEEAKIEEKAGSHILVACARLSLVDMYWRLPSEFSGMPNSGYGFSRLVRSDELWYFISRESGEDALSYKQGSVPVPALIQSILIYKNIINSDLYPGKREICFGCNAGGEECGAVRFTPEGMWFGSV